MRLYVISGLIGSGKTTVSKLLQKKGFKYISADFEVKKILRTDNLVKEKLINKFNDIILNNKKDISFKKLKEKLLESNKNKNNIEKIIHNQFYKKINIYLKKTKYKKILIEIPLIETCKAINRNYEVIMVDSKLKHRLLRKTNKTNKSITIFKKLNKLQKTRKFYKNNSNYIITNNGNMKQLKKEFEEFYKSNILEI
ncbi:MAG: dephospho-CoA kinase [Gammaproteobacteria bacterium]|nr:dephospho-CoA kinase [Gammaproteobacteria bacterium]